MSLLGFQRALADMIASPALAVAVGAGHADALDSYELTPRERMRLDVVATQPGMEVSCTLYRANRLTPIVMLLPYTCFILGDRIKAIAERFWMDSPTDMQFRNEIDSFAGFLRQLVTAGELDEPLLEEVLEFELATNELRFLPRRELSRDPGLGDGTSIRLHPLVRLVWFSHDPEALLGRLAAAEPPPYALEAGEFPLVLVAGEDELEVRQVDVRLALLLETLSNGGVTLAAEDAGLLVDEGLAIWVDD
jgi:hypothetical protein